METHPPVAQAIPQPVLSLHGVAKLFGNFAVLRDITAEFTSGKLYVITGENGAGKSTLLRIIAGLASPTRGSVDRAFGAQQLGYMAHATMLYDELSGGENLRYFGALYGLDGASADGVAAESMSTVALDPALERPVGRYSQGMRQRLALARAILHAPSLLLLDEPFSNLDAQSTQQMVAILAAQRDRGTCILLVTHQPSLLAEVADFNLHIEAGKSTVRANASRMSLRREVPR